MSKSKKILGTWYINETIEETTYKIVYEFFSNSSFFSGIWNPILKNYNMSIWGTYEIKNEKLYFTVNDPFSDESIHEYDISDDGNTLKLYYGDQSDFDILTKQN